LKKTLKALIEQGVDANGDVIISPFEAKDILSINVVAYGISVLTGIEAFVNLDTLDCYGNQLSHLDISNNPSLEEIGISEMMSLYEVCV